MKKEIENSTDAQEILEQTNEKHNIADNFFTYHLDPNWEAIEEYATL